MNLTKPQQKLKRQWVALAALIASATCAWAQSSDAVIDKLVEKGILTVKEGNELREEADKNFGQSYSVKSGMPDWVTSLKFNGDFRVRYEQLYSDATYLSGGITNKLPDRSRFRYRLRFGATVTMVDNLEAGFRLTSGDTASGFSSSTGSPLSGNSTMQDNGSKKFIYFDTAYGKWYMLNGPDWSGNITVGKMDSPFAFDEMVFDPDYTPEGSSIQVGYHLNDHNSLRLNSGAFVLDELAMSSSDPFLLGAQLRLDSTWSPKVTTTIGLSELWIVNSKSLTNSLIPNVNRGNMRDASTTPVYGFQPFIADGAVIYTVDSFPFYRGAFPIKAGGEYMLNNSAPSSATAGGYTAENYGWDASVVLGKSGKKGTWELSYTYKWLGGNAWFEELVDDDFGAFYGGVPLSDSPPFGGSGAGYGSGTNVKGHIIRFAVSPTDALTLTMKLFLTELINPFPATGIGSDSKMTRLQADASWKF